MAASSHLNPNQLRLFMQARELMDVPTTEWSSNAPGENARSMRQDSNLYLGKLEESKEGYEHGRLTFYNLKKGQKNLHESIQQEGVNHPVTLRNDNGVTSIDDGHHRIAAANDIDENMYVPVRYRS